MMETGTRPVLVKEVNLYRVRSPASRNSQENLGRGPQAETRFIRGQEFTDVVRGQT